MIKPATLCIAGAAALLSSTMLQAQSPADVQAAALEDDVAWDIVEGLTTEIGPRMAGTSDEARARDWAVAKLKSLGVSDVRVEEFDMPVWVRGAETAEVVSPFPQSMHITALGNSASTGESGLTGEVVYFPTYADLANAPAKEVKGKIVFISHNMKPTQDGSGYGFAGPARWTGANLAAKKGAKAVVIRSVGTDHHRNPHAGGTNFEEGVAPIPAGALSIPDAENLERMVSRGKPVTMKLVMTPKNLGIQKSGNVIADIKGTDTSLAPLLLGCHLDSWDLGTGAIDDASGCAIITAAALQATKNGKPARGIRLLWAGAEEVGVYGGKAYGEAHADEPHSLAMESDFGADKVWRVDFTLDDAELKTQIAQALAPLGILPSQMPAHGGADVGAIIAAQNLAVIDLQQDGTKYFDLHHTPDDTLDKIDPAQLRQNVAAWATVLSILANHDGELAPAAHDE